MSKGRCRRCHCWSQSCSCRKAPTIRCCRTWTETTGKHSSLDIHVHLTIYLSINLGRYRKGGLDGFTHHLHIPNVSVPVERALPIAVVAAAVAVLTGSVPVVEQSRGVCGGGAVSARLLLPIYLGRRMLLKRRQRIPIVVINHS